MFLQSKQEYQEKLFEILNPLVTHYNVGRARLTLGYTGATYSPTVAQIEGFARVLWGLAPYYSGGGVSREFEEIYQNGFTHGTNPKDPEYWGTVAPYQQELVEMAAIAFGLIMAPEKLWDPLSSEAKSNLVAWLNQGNITEVHPRNWKFFPILINVAFKKLGRAEYSQEIVTKNLQEINSYYVGDGWYQDGPTDRYDYYVAFALHFYGLIYSVFMSKEDPTNSKLFRERAELFGKQFLYWFDESGAGIPYGRSMTYRFAQVAFYSACIYAGVEPLDLSVMKGIIDRNLDMWWHSHMLDFSDILTIGYNYPNLIMAESYNAPGSPLWALKAFLLLALDDNHPYWQATAAPYPTVEPVMQLPKAKMILTHRNDNAIMYPSGLKYPIPVVGHLEEKYGKFAYSSKFGFSVRKANDCLENMAPDSDLVFEIGGFFFGKGASTSEVTGNKIVSHWSPFEGIDVVSTLTVDDNKGCTLNHTITSTMTCTAYACGFAVSRDAPGYREDFNNTCANILTSSGGCEVGGGPGLIIDLGVKSPPTKTTHPRPSQNNTQTSNLRPSSREVQGAITPYSGKNSALHPLPSPVAEKGD